jgi:transposase-like protein
MTDKLISEDRISLTELARELGVNCTTARRWIKLGYRGQRLESFRIGKKRYSTRQAAARFIAAVNGEPESLSAAI